MTLFLITRCYFHRVITPFLTEESKYSIFLIKDGSLYQIILSEETGEIKVKRYQVKNWTQLKEKIQAPELCHFKKNIFSAFSPSIILRAIFAQPPFLVSPLDLSFRFLRRKLKKIPRHSKSRPP